MKMGLAIAMAGVLRDGAGLAMALGDCKTLNSLKIRCQGMYTSGAKEPPPTTRTLLLLASRTAWWPWRGDNMLPVAEMLPLAGSYTSATPVSPELLAPPANRTVPSSRVVAESQERATDNRPAKDTVPEVGSKISTEFSMAPPADPPAITTRPSLRTAA